MKRGFVTIEVQLVTLLCIFASLIVFCSEWVESNYNALDILLTTSYVITAVFVIYKMIHANKLAKEGIQKAQEREDGRIRPRIVFDIYYDREEKCGIIEVRNEGITSAVGVNFEISDEDQIEDDSPFKYPISYLSPATKKRARLLEDSNFFQKYKNKGFTVEVSYKDTIGREYSKEPSYLDLTHIKTTRWVEEVDIGQQIKKVGIHLSKLEKTTQKIADILKNAPSPVSPPAALPTPSPVSPPPTSNEEYSQETMKIARWLVENSETGMRFDPRPNIENLVTETRITEIGVLEAINELEENGFVTYEASQAIPEEELFIEFDHLWMGWSTEEGAKIVAKILTKSMVDNEWDQVIQTTKRIGWSPRQLNPALCWLEKKGLVNLLRGWGSAPYVCHDIKGDQPALRRFVKKYSITIPTDNKNTQDDDQ